MSTVVRLRKVGGSVMVAIPTAYLDALAIGADHQVDMSVADGSLRLVPRARPAYSLSELLAQCDGDVGHSREDVEWTSGGPVGRELV